MKTLTKTMFLIAVACTALTMFAAVKQKPKVDVKKKDFIKYRSYVLSRDAKTLTGYVITTWRRDGKVVVETNAVRRLVGVRQTSPDEVLIDTLKKERDVLKAEKESLKAEKKLMKAERDAAKEEAKAAKEELKAEKKKKNGK